VVRYSFIIIIGVLLSSCAPSKKATVNLNAEFMLSKVAFRSQYIKTIDAGGNITVESPEFSNSANLKVQLRMPDTLSFKIEAIFGIGLGEGKIYGDSFEVIDKFNGRSLRGKVENYIQRYLGFKISFDEVVGILIASPRVDKFEMLNFDEDGPVIRMRKNYGDVILKFNSDLELESYTLVRDGEEIFKVRYSRYAKFGETTLPRLIRIWDRTGRGVYLSFSDIKVNGAN